MKIKLRIYLGLIAAMGLLTLSPLSVFSQCNTGGSASLAGSLTMQPFYQTQTVNAGQRYTFTGNASITYVFSFCEGGGNNTFDTQIEICNSAGTVVYAYNDDFCGLGSHLSWTCTTTGTYSIVIYRYSCNLSGGTGSTLAYQVLTPPTVQDCLGAIPLCQSYYSTSASYSGTGNYPAEIPTTGGCPGNCMTSGERNDVWYTFTPQTPGNVAFVINPNNSSDDYDWAVYDITTGGCAAVTNNINSVQVSCNWSATSGATGPTGSSTYSCVGSGTPNQNATIPITVGHTYVVNVSNFSSTQYGYSINFAGSSAGIVDTQGASIMSLLYPPVCGSSALSVQFSERLWCTGVTPSDFTLTGPNGTYNISDVWSDLCEAGLNSTYGDTYYDDVWNLDLSDYLQHDGNYTLTVNAGGVDDICSNYSPQSSVSFTIDGIEATGAYTDPSCFNTNDGTITLSGISGGTPPYNINWTGPSGFTSTQQNLTGLAPGSYSVTIGDSYGMCEWEQTIVLNAPPAVSANISTSNPGCGVSNGSITITPTSGYSPFTAQVNAMSHSGITTNYTFTNLGGGTYGITLTDSHGCTNTTSVVLTAPNNPDATFTYNGNQCFTGQSYNFTHTGTNIPGETYSWNFGGGSPSSSTTENPTGITFTTPGTHTVNLTVTAGSCIDSESVDVTVYADPSPVVSTTSENCGACDGTASIATSYSSYSWSPGGTGNSINSLCAGNYTVTVQDANGCIGSSPFSITSSGSMPSANVITSQPSCPGYCNGSATVNASGAPSYSYQFSDGTTPNNQTTGGLCAGSYTVTVADGTNPSCFTVENFSISDPAGMNLTMSSTDATCGLSNGTATVSVSGGSTPYSYNWSNGGVTGTINNIPAGTYTVTVTSGTSCTAEGTVSVVDGGVPFSISTSVVSNASCNNLCDGSASVSVTGGTGPFTYNWSSGSNPSSATVNGLCDGTHYVTVTEGSCSVNTSVLITEPTPITATISTVGAHCGLADGSATVSASGGTESGTYDYTWNTTPAQYTATANNIIAGAYTVTVEDDNGCTASFNGNVPDLGGISVNITTTPAACNGASDGTATAHITGGIADYNYLWHNGTSVNTASLTNAISTIAGTVSVTVTDASGCTATANNTIAQPPVLSLAMSNVTPASCNGICDGTATLNVTGGTPPISYTWSSGNNPNAATNSNLCSGLHSVTVSDLNGCTSAMSYSIAQPLPIVLSTNTLDAHCGLSDGAASVNATGGTIVTDYSYQWSGGNNPTNDTVTNLSAAGSPYTVTVTDDNGCFQTGSVTINDAAGPAASISSFSGVGCQGMNNGQATVSVGGGTSPYTYLWNTTPPQTAVTAMNLGMGYYEVTVTDAIGCTTTAGINITEPSTLTLDVIDNVVDCYGDCSGEAYAHVTGGTTPYSALWSNLNTSLLNTGLCAGDYSVTITDANNCSVTNVVTIIENDPIIITGNVTNADCNQSNGSIDVEVTGGSPPFDYIWNTGDVTQDLLNISSGTYIISVIDNKGCVEVMNFAVNNISGPVATINSTSDVSCFGLCNGIATVSVTGGSGLFQYNWSTTPSQTTATATNLCAGSYSVQVIDVSTGCIANSSTTINEPDQMDALSTVNDAGCYGACDGSIELTPYDGTAPYTFNWTGPGVIPNDEDLYNLCPGDYTVAISDSHGCLLTQTFTVENPDFITIPVSSTPTVCSGTCDGTASASPYGGTPPYIYLWSDNAQSTQTAVGLCAGNYNVTVFDSNGCTGTNNVTVSTPTELTFANVTVNDALCYGGSSGNIQVIPTGGIPPYDFYWSNGSTIATPTNLTSGQHCVTVTDDNGCSIDTCVFISEPPVVSSIINVTNETCFNSCNGSIEAIVSGGEAPFTYLWSNNATASTIDNLCTGLYNLTITDNNGCEYYTSGSISGPSILDVTTQNTIQSHCGNADGLVSVAVIGGTNPYIYDWSNPGGNTNTLNNIPSGTYTVTVTDANGCIAIHDVNLNDISAPEITDIIVTNVTCSSEATGSAEVQFTSSTPTNTIAWSDGQTGPIAINLTEGTYSVTITDENGCNTSESITITEPNALSLVLANINNVSCNGFCNGSATVQIFGGTQPVLITWSNGQTGITAVDLCAGDYGVTATDDNGCVFIESFEITEPDPIEITGTVTPATCYGSCNGIISLEIVGGNNNYFVSWPQLGQNTAVVEGLCAGSHSVVVFDQNDASCFVQESYIVTQPPPINASFATDNATCGINNGSAWVTTIYGGSGSYNYQWNPGGYTMDSIYNAAPGTYNVLITDMNGCTASYQVGIGVTQPPHLDNVNFEDVTCFGGSDGSAEIFVSQGMPPYEYNWSPNVTDEWANYELSSGIYAVTVVDADGCAVYTTFPISSPEEIQIYTAGNTTICIGESAIVSASASGGIPPYSLAWVDLGTGPSFFVSPIVTTDYNVVAIDANGCESATGQVHIEVNPPLHLTLTTPPSICEGSSAQIIANAEGGDGNYLYHWSDGTITLESTTVVSPTQNTTYEVVLTDGCNTPNDTATVMVIVSPGPEIDIFKNPYKGCSPLLVTFDNETNNMTYTYDWDFGDPLSGALNWSDLKRPTHLFEESGSYAVSVTVTTTTGCSEIGTTTIKVHNAPLAEFIAHPWSTGLFDSNIDFTDQSMDAIAWEWHFGDGYDSGEQHPSHTFYGQGEFPVTLIAYSQDGCVDTVVHNIDIIEDHRLYMPTAINIRTPGNDELYPKGVGFDYDTYNFAVYNRWGEMIFATNNINEHWKGRYNQNKGDYVPQGVYSWIITLQDKWGKDHTYSGNVTVFK
jgi:hypothetical protein